MDAERYRTVQGDAFDGIAWRIWGQEHMAPLLIAANPAWADVLVFEPGVELVVPEATVKTTVEQLPPWYGETR